MKIKRSKSFSNGSVYALELSDGHVIETTDTFLPYYTKFCTNENSNKLLNDDLGSRSERWMIGVSVMSSCCVGCKFCATGNLKKFRNLTAQEIVDQVDFIVSLNKEKFIDAKEHKINFTRCGEPFLNINNVKEAINILNEKYPNTHMFISTIGVKNSDFSWIKDNITLQVSLHSLDNDRRNDLIPFKNKMTIEELGQIRTNSNLKTTINMTLVDYKDFDINKLKELFSPEHFFIKVSPLNPNKTSEKNGIVEGIIKARNIQ